MKIIGKSNYTIREEEQVRRGIDRPIDRLRGQFDGLRGVAAVQREELYSWMRNDSTKLYSDVQLR